VNGNGARGSGTRDGIDATPRSDARLLAATTGAVLAASAALFIVSLDPWPGPTLLAVSATHGIDTGDLVVAPLLALALFLLRLGAGTPSAGGSAKRFRTTARWAGPSSAVLLGILLLVAAFSRLGDGFTGLGGRFDRLVAVAVVAAASWFGIELVRSGHRWTGRQGQTWWIPVGVLALGLMLDLVSMPSATAFSALALAVWFAATATDRLEARLGWVMAGGLALGNAAALAGVADAIAPADGGVTRAVAVGGLLIVVGLLRARNRLLDQGDRERRRPIAGDSSSPVTSAARGRATSGRPGGTNGIMTS